MRLSRLTGLEIEKLEADNVLRNNLDIETISLGVRLGKAALSLGHSPYAS